MAYNQGEEASAGDGLSYEGAVKSWNPEKGWGHIECQDTFDQFGKDVFLLKSQLKNAPGVHKGQRVTFSLMDNGRGPEATDVTVHDVPFSGGSGVYSGGMMCAPGAGEFVGTIKSFNPNSGWGHITCQQTEQIYGKDVFFMKSQLQNCAGGVIAKGTSVAFSVVQGTKGPEAQKVQPMGGQPMGGCGGGMPMTRGLQPYPQYGGMTSGPIMPMQQQSWNGGGAMQQAMHAPGASFYGTIKSFNEEKGWGHITCQQTQAIYGRDMFLLRSQLMNGAAVSAGDAVQFSVGNGQKGPEAQGVRVLGAGASPGQSYMGTIKNWNEEKGWGFISCTDTHSLYGKDIFVHKNFIVGGHTPAAGEQVQFSVQISDQGRPEAGSVSFGGGAYGPYKGTAGMAAERSGPWSWNQ